MSDSDLQIGYQDAVPLACETDPAWLPLALERFDEVLCDHAHCEKKAASQAISFLATWPEKVRLVQAMSRLAHEELTHFRQVYDRIQARGLVLGRDPGNPYAKALRKQVRADNEATRLTDLLLVCALIEARSHERLALLADALPDEDLRQFYAGLAQAEGGHARLFVQLAIQYDERNEALRRLAELSTAEGEILSALPVKPRIH
ncbi:MAG: tRNA-(ms[2]io[6]A)-hydroxylase [Planctomycetes bacterium]|nr:tRNA-(ms[2]io[6]A)-hydroxylase [Planctomycetota bacterium]